MGRVFAQHIILEKEKMRKSLLAFLLVPLVLPPLAAQQDEEEMDVFELEAYEVVGTEFDAMRQAIQSQREAGNIKTVLDAGAFGDVTEGNVGEFLKYLPGVSVDFVSADVRSVSVRGLASNFTPVTMDGNRMASAASSESSRTFEFEQVSLNNVARIEVVKVPVPSMEADSLGGSVNMVSRNAFEINERRLDYRFYLMVPEDYIRAGKTPGPGNKSTHKIRPGFDLTYSDPVTENFGIVVNYKNAETFTPQDYFITQWDLLLGQGQENPFLRYFNLRDGPKVSERESFGLELDWRLHPTSILSFGYQLNEYSTTFYNREVRWEISGSVVSPDSYGPTYTSRDPSKSPNARFRHQVNTREKTGETNHVDIGMQHFFGKWEIEYDAYFSESTNTYRDTDNGVFERVVFRTDDPTLDVRYEDIGPNGPEAVVTLRNGEPFDPFPFTDDTPLEYLRSSPEDASDTIYGAKLDVLRNLDLGNREASVKTGLLFRNQEREIERRQFRYDPNGFYQTLNPGSSTFRDAHYTGMPLGFGWPAPEWPDPARLYQYYLDHPEQFDFREVDAVIYNEENRQRVEETVSAAYLMGTLSFFDRRLKVIGGLRYERTETEGEGFAYDETIIYELNPDGSFKKKVDFLPDNPQNRIIREEFAGDDSDPSVLASRVKAQYSGRRTTKASYWDTYPSIHFTYLITDNLQARFAYARTLGRPDIDDLAPGIRYNSVASADDDGIERFTIEVNNPELEAYTGDNFDLSLEYYFESGGVASAGVFHKTIKGFIDTQTTLLTDELASSLGIDPVYVDLGWQVETTVNAGDVTIEGFEVSLIQELGALWEPLDGFSVFANATVLSTEGDYGAQQSQLVSSYIPGFVKQTGNWGITYDKGRWDIRLKWNDRGKQMRDSGTIRGTFNADGSVWNRFYDRRLTTDINIEYRFNDYIRLFLNGRNIFDEPTDQLRIGENTPAYAYLERREKFGALWTIGVKGSY